MEATIGMLLANRGQIVTIREKLMLSGYDNEDRTAKAANTSKAQGRHEQSNRLDTAGKENREFTLHVREEFADG